MADKLPAPTVSVSWMLVPRASASGATTVQPVSGVAVSSSALKVVGGTVRLGRVTATVLMAALKLAVLAPPEPVLPPSSTASNRLTDVEPVYWMLLTPRLDAAMKALMAETWPCRVRVAVPSPPTVTPPALVALNTPPPAVNVSVTKPVPASTSAIVMPVTFEANPTGTENTPGALIVGASLTGSTVIVLVTTPLLSCPSVTLTLTVRTAELGLSLVLV